MILAECPFFKTEKNTTRMTCELCSFKFPDKQARDDLVYVYCADSQNYKNCMCYKILMDYYDRKERNGGNGRK